MVEENSVITKAFGRFLTGFTLAKAILEDYARVVSKLENTTEQEVMDRIRKRSGELFDEIKAEQLKETEEWKQQQAEQ